MDRRLGTVPNAKWPIANWPSHAPMFLVQIASYHYCIVICIVDVHGTAKRWSPYKAIFSPTALRVLLQYIMVAFRKKEYSNNHRQRFPTVLGASYLSREIFSKLRIFEFALCTAARRQRRYQFKDDQILFSPPLMLIIVSGIWFHLSVRRLGEIRPPARQRSFK